MMQRTVTRVLFHPVNADGDRGADPVELSVVVTHQDKLRAETEARTKHGLKADLREAPMTWTTLFAYLALVREGHYAGPWQQFKNRDCVALEEGDDEPVDPTRGTHTSDSPSPSPASGPASTGSQPTTD